MSSKLKEEIKPSKMKWVILLMSCLTCSLTIYCLDNVAVLHDALKIHFSHLGNNFEFYFNLLYSVYSLPNIFLPIIGGIFISKYGRRLMYFFFGFFVMLGQFLFAFGCEHGSISFMLIGRVVFGLGGECIALCVNTLIVKWFAKEEMGLSMGLSVSIARVGSVMNGLLSPQLSHYKGVTYPIWIGFCGSVLSLVLITVICIIDKTSEIKTQKESIIIKESDSKSKNSSINTNSNFKKLNSLFWLLTVFILCFYGAIIPFNYIASGFLIDSYFYNLPQDEAQILAGIYIIIPYFMSTFLIPLFGLAVDKFGKRSHILFISALLGVFAFSCLFFLPPLCSLFFLGLTYSMVAATAWPCISLVIDADSIGFACGIIGSLQNIMLAFIPLISAYLIKSSGSYYVVLLFFIFLVLTGGIVSILLMVEDQKENCILSKRKEKTEGENGNNMNIKLVSKEEKMKDSFKTSYYRSLISKDDFSDIHL